MRIRGTTRVALAVTGALALAALVPSSAPAGAAGVTTHGWMGLTAIERVADDDLKTLLSTHAEQVRSGAQFPDGGYVPGNAHGEEAHWSRFTDAYAAQILARDDCGDLTAPDGPCAAEVAHLMGVLAHGMGDEVWDWLFEPNSPDLDEYYLPEELSAVQDGGGQELVMDLVAIGVHGRTGGALPPLPSKPDLLAAFDAAGLDGVTPEMLDTGQVALQVIYQAEASWVAQHLPGVLAEMPWMSHNVVDAPGGVSYAADAIAAQWESMWGHLLGDRSATEVGATYPAAEQRRIPATGWVRTYQPGSHPGRGGARTRISASLSYALPYDKPGVDPDVPPVSEQLPAGSMTLTDLSTDELVPLLAGYPRVVPYGPGAGTHNVDLQPGADLTPCTWYRVDITSSLLDADGNPVVPYAWTFRTGTDGAGRRCADDPFTSDERYVQAAYGDLFERGPGGGELEGWTARFDRGLTPAAFASGLVGSTEHRRRLVRDAYTDILHRLPSTADRDFWVGQLRTRSLTYVRSRLLGSTEFLTRFGAGAPSVIVDATYDRVLGRAPDDAGGTFWVDQIAGGLSPTTFAARLLASPESARRIVRGTYDRLLDQQPGGPALDFWWPRVAAADERVLVAAILRSNGYYGHAQAA